MTLPTGITEKRIERIEFMCLAIIEHLAKNDNSMKLLFDLLAGEIEEDSDIGEDDEL